MEFRGKIFPDCLIIRGTLLVLAAFGGPLPRASALPPFDSASFCNEVLGSHDLSDGKGAFIALVRKLILEKNALTERALEAFLTSNETGNPLDFESRHLTPQEISVFKNAFGILLNTSRFEKFDWKSLRGEIRKILDERNAAVDQRVTAHRETSHLFFPVVLEEVPKNSYALAFVHDGKPIFSRYYDSNHRELFNLVTGERYPYPGIATGLINQLTPDGSIYSHSSEWRTGRNVDMEFRAELNLFVINMNTRETHQFDIEKMGMSNLMNFIPELVLSYFLGEDGLIKAVARKHDTSQAEKISFLDFKTGAMHIEAFPGRRNSVFVTKAGRVFAYDHGQTDIPIVEIRNPFLKPVTKLESFTIKVPGRDNSAGLCEIFEDPQGGLHFVGNGNGLLTHFDLGRRTSKTYTGLYVKDPPDKKADAYKFETIEGKVYSVRNTLDGIAVINFSDDTLKMIKVPADVTFNWNDPRSAKTVLLHQKNGESYAVTTIINQWHEIDSVLFQSLKHDQVYEIETKGFRLRELLSVYETDEGNIEGFFEGLNAMVRVQLKGPVKK
jgi:hypothetical protein